MKPLKRLIITTYTSEHAWSCSTNLQVILANLCSVEHRVKRSDFINLHRGHLQNLGDLVHRGKCQEVIVLLLSNEQDRDHTG